MKNQIGTVLPNAETYRLADKFAADRAVRDERIASRDLAGTTRRVVGGEVRYYDTTDQYAIVSRQGKAIWFAVRPDGDYRI